MNRRFAVFLTICLVSPLPSLSAAPTTDPRLDRILSELEDAGNVVAVEGKVALTEPRCGNIGFDLSGWLRGDALRNITTASMLQQKDSIQLSLKKQLNEEVEMLLVSHTIKMEQTFHARTRIYNETPVHLLRAGGRVTRSVGSFVAAVALVGIVAVALSETFIGSFVKGILKFSFYSESKCTKETAQSIAKVSYKIDIVTISQDLLRVMDEFLDMMASGHLDEDILTKVGAMDEVEQLWIKLLGHEYADSMYAHLRTRINKHMRVRIVGVHNQTLVVETCLPTATISKAIPLLKVAPIGVMDEEDEVYRRPVLPRLYAVPSDTKSATGLLLVPADTVTHENGLSMTEEYGSIGCSVEAMRAGEDFVMAEKIGHKFLIATRQRSAKCLGDDLSAPNWEVDDSEKYDLKGRVFTLLPARACMVKIGNKTIGDFKATIRLPGPGMFSWHTGIVLPGQEEHYSLLWTVFEIGRTLALILLFIAVVIFIVFKLRSWCNRHSRLSLLVNTIEAALIKRIWPAAPATSLTPYMPLATSPESIAFLQIVQALQQEFDQLKARIK